jgi:hypothetical protein
MPTSREEAAIATRDLATGLYTTSAVITAINKPISELSKRFKSIETISSETNKLNTKLEKLGKLSDILSKVGFTRPFAKVVDKVIDGVQKKIEKAND